MLDSGMDAVLPGERPAVRNRILKLAPSGTITAGRAGRKRAFTVFPGRTFGALAELLEIR
jgi:hypothetical protein